MRLQSERNEEHFSPRSHLKINYEVGTAFKMKHSHNYLPFNGDGISVNILVKFTIRDLSAAAGPRQSERAKDDKRPALLSNRRNHRIDNKPKQRINALMLTENYSNYK